MSMVLQERGFGSLPSSTKMNPRDQVKSISTTIEADSHPIRRIGSPQYVVSTGQNRTLMYNTRQTTIPFPSYLNGYYCDGKKRSYGLQFSEAYSKASHIDEFIPQKEKDLGSFTLPCFISNVCFDNALVDLGASISVMPLLTSLNLGLGELAHTKLKVELADRTAKYPKGIAENILVRIGKFTFPIDFIILDMPKDIKVPLILGRPFFSTARDKIDVYKRKITLRVGKEKIIFKSVKPASSLIKRVYMLSLRERMKLDLEAKLMGETLLRRNQGDDLMPTIEEGEVIEEFRTRDEDLDTGIDDYPSYCDDDKKICIDCADTLKFSCMIGFEFTHVNFFPLLYVNVMSKKFHNSIMKDKMVYKGDNVVGALMNVPIIVGTFFVVTDFAVLEDMDAYRDERMDDVIVDKPFLREVGIKARRFDGMIIIYNGDDEVTYQMVRSHPKFKHHTKGPDYIRDAKTEEWLTCEHVSMHEMEIRFRLNLLGFRRLCNLPLLFNIGAASEDLVLLRKIEENRLISLDLSRLATTLNRLERSIQIGIYKWYQSLLSYMGSHSKRQWSRECLNRYKWCNKGSTSQDCRRNFSQRKRKKSKDHLAYGLPEDHLAKFHKMTDAKEMWEAIKSRFGGNDESKKMQNQLEIHGAGISTEDSNQKFLGSLPVAWSQVSLITRTKLGVDSLISDDLYNNIRVFESDVKGSTASSSSMQNVAFVSENTSNTNEVSTAYGASTSSGHNPLREGSSSYTDELMYSFFANQSSGPQLDHEHLEQLDEFDFEEMDLKWQVAMISMRLKKLYKKSGRKLHFDAKEPVGFDKTKVECYNCHKKGHFARECRSKGNIGYKSKDNGRRPGK
ncbi:hypothetical protein Tco_0747197 [Tanacetum coccineum]